MDAVDFGLAFIWFAAFLFSTTLHEAAHAWAAMRGGDLTAYHGGQVTLEAVLRAFYEGLQLAVILCCVGAANSLGSARRLLRYVPGALYEIGVACVIALTFAPQLVTDAQRVRDAHRLRGRRTRGPGSLKRLAMPVLERVGAHRARQRPQLERLRGRARRDGGGLFAPHGVALGHRSLRLAWRRCRPR